jgi:hypothetical protein
MQILETVKHRFLDFAYIFSLSAEHRFDL